MAWTSSSSLKASDAILTRSGRKAYVKHVFRRKKVETVLNLEVNVFHSYFVGRTAAWVHNASERVTGLYMLGENESLSALLSKLKNSQVGDIMLLNHYLPVEDMAWLSRKLGNVELNSLEFAVKSQTGDVYRSTFLTLGDNKGVNSGQSESLLESFVLSGDLPWGSLVSVQIVRHSHVRVGNNMVNPAPSEFSNVDKVDVLKDGGFIWDDIEAAKNRELRFKALREKAGNKGVVFEYEPRSGIVLVGDFGVKETRYDSSRNSEIMLSDRMLKIRTDRGHSVHELVRDSATGANKAHKDYYESLSAITELDNLVERGSALAMKHRNMLLRRLIRWHGVAEITEYKPLFSKTTK